MPAATRLKAPVVELTVPATSEFLRIIRLLVAGVGGTMNLPVEEIEDLKLAVGEACSNLFEDQEDESGSVDIRMTLDERRLVVEVHHRSPRAYLPRLFASGRSFEAGIGVILMKHLMDKVEYSTSPESVMIRLTKSRREAIPT